MLGRFPLLTENTMLGPHRVMGFYGDEEKRRIWEEIRQLVHIGRSVNDIEQTLSDMGYNRLLLREMLSIAFMETLLEKEERFVDLLQSENSEAKEKARLDEQDSLEQKTQEEEKKRQYLSEELIRQQEHSDELQLEKRHLDMMEQRVSDAYATQEDAEKVILSQGVDEMRTKKEQDMLFQNSVL